MKIKIDSEFIYSYSPTWLQNILVTLEGGRIRRRRYDDRFHKMYLDAQNRGVNGHIFFHSDYQSKRLQVFLKQAQKSPYWKRKFSELSVDPDAKDLFAELAKLPVLSKAEVKAHIDEIDLAKRDGLETISCHTSGTTGSGLVFPVTRDSEREQWATWWRYRSWHGIGFDSWCGYFGGRSLVSLGQKKPPFWRVNRPGRQLMFSAYHLSEHTTADYVAALNRWSVPWLHGYPSTLALLAGLKISLGLPDVPSIKLITIGAESLLPQQKALMEKAFGAPVRQHYGMAEGVANISECPEGNLHVDEDFSFVEFVPVAGQENSYKIIGTNWNNFAFPLFRYDTNDIVTIESVACHCGRKGRVISQIDGRKEDFVVLANGAKIGRLDHIFKDMVKIHAAQIYQPNTNEIILRIIPGKDYNRKQDELLLLTETRKRLGQEIKITVDYVEHIEKTNSGKLRFVISDIKENKIA